MQPQVFLIPTVGYFTSSDIDKQLQQTRQLSVSLPRHDSTACLRNCTTLSGGRVIKFVIEYVRSHTFLRAVVEEPYFEEGHTFVAHYGVVFRGVVEPHDMSVRELRPVQEENVIDILMHQSIWVFHVVRLRDDQLHAKTRQRKTERSLRLTDVQNTVIINAFDLLHHKR